MVAEYPQENLKKILTIESAAMTSCGPSRTENQDAIVLDGLITQCSNRTLSKKLISMIPFSVSVVDGMGGYDGGADAACLVAIAISKFSLSNKDSVEINEYFNSLSGKVLRAGHAWGTPEMGAAFAMLTLDGDMLTIANIGDCRIYKYLEDEDIFCQISEDDRSRSGNGITQSIGCVMANLDAHFFSQQIQANTQLLLCCDGVWGTLGDDELQNILRKNLTAVDAINEMRKCCYERNASDNCSAILVKLSEPQGKKDTFNER